MTCWKDLPDIIFGDILIMMGLNSLEHLHRCRQVCQGWNVMIAPMTKYKKDTIRRTAESLMRQGKELVKDKASHISLANGELALSIASYARDFEYYVAVELCKLAIERLEENIDTFASESDTNKYYGIIFLYLIMAEVLANWSNKDEDYAKLSIEVQAILMKKLYSQ